MIKKHKQYSFFLGRFQPLHDGHIKLIRTTLNEGKNVCIGLREADLSESNPYSYRAREQMFWNEFKQEIMNGKLETIRMPDIIEICHGRKVGWGIREIKLDKKTEKISATKIRKAKKK